LGFNDSSNYSFLIDRARSRYILWGHNPFAVFCYRNNRCEIYSDGKWINYRADPWDEIRRLLRELRKITKEKDGGVAGYIGYNAAKTIEPSLRQNEFKSDVPDIALMFFRNFKTTEKSRIKIFNKTSVLSYKSNKIGDVCCRPEITNVFKMPLREYSAKIAKIKEYICEGEVYQVNLSHRVEYRFKGDPWRFYVNLREVASPQFGVFLNLGDINVISVSPERFLRKRGRMLETFPIKGTMPRSENKKEDRRLKGLLRTSIKDNAEHLMIVDLLRNDLGRVCEYGSVKVDDLFAVRSFKTVHHMVSRISGRVKNGLDVIDILKSCFPGGSVTGTPKIKAMQIIDEVEGYNRGIYTGSIGYISADGSMDMNIAIRTMIIRGNRAYYPVGGAIVYDSDPVQEYMETETKLKVLEETIRRLKNEDELLLP